MINRMPAFRSFRYQILPIAMMVAMTADAQRPGGGQRPDIRGRIFGRVLDAASQKPIEFATVALFSTANDSVVAGMLTRQNGDFSLDGVKGGRYRFRVSSVGFETRTQDVAVTPNRIEQDLGDLELTMTAG